MASGVAGDITEAAQCAALVTQAQAEGGDLTALVVPLRRIGRADDVGAAVAYLVSPSASYVTGQNLLVDGGVSDHMLM